MNPTWYNFADFLIAELPELREEIESSYLYWLDAYQNPYPHVFLDEFIAPLLLGTGTLRDDAHRTRAGEILDRVLNCADADLSEAAARSILDALGEDAALRETAWPFLGATAREWLTRHAAST